METIEDFVRTFRSDYAQLLQKFWLDAYKILNLSRMICAIKDKQ